MAVFTSNFVAGLKPAAKIYEERDAGCPGLIIRVGQRGRKVWEVMVSRDGKRKRVRLGTFPEVSLAMARRMASERKSAPAIHSDGMRVRDLWSIYSAEMRPIRRAFRDVELVWQMWAEPVIGNVRLDDVNMRHGAALIDRVAQKSTPDRARKVIRYIAPMFRFAAGRGLIPGNPWAGLHTPEGVPPRDRVLSLTEWQSLWGWAEAAPYPWGAFIGTLMLTAQRRSEVAGMRWSEIHGDVWAIPAKRRKNKAQHELPLSGAVITLLAGIPKAGDLVFSTRPGKPIVPSTALCRKIQAATGTSNWRLHDLRRTGATIMAEGGVNRFVIERVLGHSDRSVTAVYDRATYRDEKRAALKVLAETMGAADGKDGGILAEIRPAGKE